MRMLYSFPRSSVKTRGHHLAAHSSRSALNAAVVTAPDIEPLPTSSAPPKKTRPPDGAVVRTVVMRAVRLGGLNSRGLIGKVKVSGVPVDRSVKVQATRMPRSSLGRRWPHRFHSCGTQWKRHLRSGYR